MKKLLESIVKNLVDYPDKILITETQEDDVTILTLKVDESDMGKVIGKRGKIVRAIRTVVKAAATNGKKVVVKI